MASRKKEKKSGTPYQVPLSVSIFNEPTGYLQDLFLGIYLRKIYDIGSSPNTKVRILHLNEFVSRHALATADQSCTRNYKHQQEYLVLAKRPRRQRMSAVSSASVPPRGMATSEYPLLRSLAIRLFAVLPAIRTSRGRRRETRRGR